MELVQGDKVLEWLIDGTGATVDTTAQAIGLIDDSGKLVAASAYSGYNGQSVVVHQRIVGRVNRAYWHAVFEYPFIDLDAKCLIGLVHSDNTEALRLNDHLGFKREALLKGVAPDGNDMIIFTMWKDDCRMLKWGRNGQKRENASGTELCETGRTAITI